MTLKIQALAAKDHAKAINYAIKGMHFNWYFDHSFPLSLYAHYFWYMELTKATQVIAAYDEDEFVGVLLARFNDEAPVMPSFWKSCYVKLFDLCTTFFVGEGVSGYDKANQEMLANYKKHHALDGEIVFLAADPNSQTKGIGTALLQELERRRQGKTVYLYTDNACTYQFYEHRGFKRSDERWIVLELGKKQVNLQCLFYTKTLG